ncbi:MAG: hypothetical protein M1457_04725, partial [bacterium]|nr:hypothetical protein [bacterium]
GAGSGIYIRNVTFTNSWRGLDLGTHRCDNFKVAGCSGSTKDIHIYIGGGSRHWALESCWNVWSFDADYPSPVDGHIINFAERAKVSGSTVARIPFKLGECTDGTVFDTEVFNPAGEYFDAAGKPLGIAGKVAMRLGVEGRGVRRVDFMLLKHDVCKGFVLTRGDAINMVMPHDTLEWSVVEPTFTGTLNQFMAQCWSQGIWGAFTQVDGGTVNVYQGYGARQIDVNGGTTRLFGLMFAGGFRSHPPYRGILENVLVGPGATRVEVTGCASSTGEEVTAANKAAPDRLAVRDCIGSGEPTAEASALRQ